MEDIILITELNDFIFCPASIYFHHLYGGRDPVLFQSESQLNGTKAHETVDSGRYSKKSKILQSLDVYCEKYRLLGKIDIYDGEKKLLRERKRQIKQIYDGYIFQLYAQYFSLVEMGYEVDKMELYSMVDNKKYLIELPHNNIHMFMKFEALINEMREFRLNDEFIQKNVNKCKKCIYEPACYRGRTDVK